MATYQEQIAKRAAEREAKTKAEDQLKNWRHVLAHMIGPYALIMPENMVRECWDLFQKRLAELDRAEERQFAAHDDGKGNK